MSTASTTCIDSRRSQVNLRVPADFLATIAAHAASRGETLTGYLLRAAEETRRRDRVAQRCAEARAAFAGVVFVDTSKEE